jgi:hypothetical protein
MPDHEHHRQPDEPDADLGNNRSGEGSSPESRSPEAEVDQVVGDADNDDTVGLTARPPFYWVIPDFTRVDPRKLLPPTAGRLKAGGQTIAAGLRWLIHAAVIAQGRSSVVLPDLIFYQVLWGGYSKAWPANRRQDVLATLRDRAPGWGIESVRHLEAKPTRMEDGADGDGIREKSTPDADEEKGHPCRPGCVLHGSNLRHHHFVITIRTARPDAAVTDPATDDGDDGFAETFLGTLEVFGDGDEELRTYQWDPVPPPKTTKDMAPEDAAELEAEQRQYALIQKLKWAGMTPAVYFPTLVFGSSRQLRLPIRQRLLHRAIMGELTRIPRGRKSDRPDRAEVVIGGQSIMSKGGASVYAGLSRGVRYVGFNGNGFGKRKKFHGRGYALRSWMERTKYPASELESEFWTAARRFLNDLDAVADAFGLVVAAWHPKRQEWQPLDALSGLSRSVDGQRWLRGARLRVYTRDDYIDRWRTWFASRMGFSVIPRPDDELSSETGPHTSATALRAALSAAGVTQADFALAVGVSKSEVSKRLNGSLSWHSKWSDRVKKALGEHPEWTERVSKNSG